MKKIIQRTISDIINDNFKDCPYLETELTPADLDEGMPAQIEFKLVYLIEGEDTDRVRNAALRSLHDLNAVEGVIGTLEFTSYDDKQEEFCLIAVDEWIDEDEGEDQTSDNPQS